MTNNINLLISLEYQKYNTKTTYRSSQKQNNNYQKITRISTIKTSLRYSKNIKTRQIFVKNFKQA